MAGWSGPLTPMASYSPFYQTQFLPPNLDFRIISMVTYILIPQPNIVIKIDGLKQANLYL